MRLPSIAACLFSAALAPLALPAAELALREAGVGLTIWPTSFDWDLESSVVSGSGSDAFDSAAAIDAGLRWSFAGPGRSMGLLASADLMAVGMPYDDGDGMAMIAARLGGGGAWAISDNWTISAEVGIGYGLAAIDIGATADRIAFEADGGCLFYDARLRVAWHLNRRWSLNAGVGWLIAEYDLSGDDVDLTLEQSGLFYSVGLSWRISDLPATLE